MRTVILFCLQAEQGAGLFNAVKTCAAVHAELQLQLQQESLALDSNLVDGFNLAVERFEVEHPTLTGTLRNLLQTLANMGI